MKKVGVITAAVFFVVDVADGKPVGEAAVDNLVIDRELVFSLGEMGKAAVSDFVDESRANTQRGLRHRYDGSGIEDIVEDI